MNVLAIIPARLGSKGIPRKNIEYIGDYTLVERALFLALKSQGIKEIIVSTDSIEIMELVNKYGNFAPFKRPMHLSTDKSGSIGFLEHGLIWAEKNYNTRFDYILLLEPTCPFRLPEHVSNALEIAKNNLASSVVSLVANTFSSVSLTLSLL